MTAPGGTNVGTAYGKVRIDYESTGVARAVKDVEALQHSMVDAGKGATQAAKQFDRAQGQITSAATAATKALEKGIHVTAPISITPGKVDLDTGAITKAVSNYKDIKRQPITIATGVKLYPTKVDIDKGSITRTIESLSRNGALSQKIKVKAPVEVETTDVSVNTAAIESAVRGRGLDRITLRAPITIDPSDITINQGALTNISQQISGAMNRGAAQQGSSGGGSGLGAAGAGGALAMAARVGGPAAAAIAPVGALGLILTKGFSRLQGLDQAAIKLSALGKSTEEIASVSQSALKSVEGTAFGLDSAFNVAANAMSSGVKSGAELDKFLSATASTAALAGVSMEDLGMQFAEARVQGKLTGDILQSLYARNIPVIQLLAKEYGVTDAAAQQMVSNGEVAFDRFLNAMNQNADAAKVMGNTVGGSFDNLMASVSRVGAMLLAPLFGQATGEASTMAEVIQSLTDRLKQFEGFLKENKTTIVDFWEDAAKGGILFGQGVTNVLGWVIEGIGKLIEGIGHVPSAFAGFFEMFGGEGIARNLRQWSDNMTDWGTATFEAGQKVHSFDDTLDRTWGSLTNWANEAREGGKQTGALTDAVDAASPPMQTLGEALEKLGIKADSVNGSITGTVQQFNDLMDQLERKNAPKELTDALQKLRDEYDNGGRAAESYEEAIENMADQTIDASSKADALISSLQKLGILPGGAALAEYNEQFEQMTSYARDLPDPLSKIGTALKNADGTINSGESNGRKLLSVIEEARQSLFTLAASGEVPAGEAFDRTAEGLRLVLQDYGLMGAEAESIIDKYLTGGRGRAAFEAEIKGGDPRAVIEQAFANDPAKLDSMLDLITTKEDILNELLGGPGSTLKIPATLDVSGSSPQGWWGQPGAPTTPGGTGGLGQSTFTVPPPGSAPPAESGKTEASIPAQVIPEDKGFQLPFDPWKWIRENLSPEGTTGSSGMNLEPTSLQGKTDEEIKALLAQNPEIEAILHNRVVLAESQGQSLAEAFAQGINEGDEKVRAAIIGLAEIAAGGLGSSPAKYGPLSGQGWTLYRGKTFTNDYAEGIVSQASSAQSAVSQMAGAATVPFGQQIETLIKDLTDISNFGKLALDFGKQLADIAFTGLRIANDLSGGRLFPKSYEVDKGFDSRRGSALGPWNPTRNPPPGAPFNAGSPAGPGRQLPAGKVDPNAKGDSVAQAFIAQAQARGWNQEQILAGLGVLNQETAYGTNPATNNVQNQNGTPGITGVFQQDMGYRKYGDPRDVNNAINGFITEFENRGGMNADPWDFAVSGVQKPANVGAGGYWDRSGGAGDYLKENQRGQALEVYNRIVGSATQFPTTTTTPAAGATQSGSATDVFVDGKWYPQDAVELKPNGIGWQLKSQSPTGTTTSGTTGSLNVPAGLDTQGALKAIAEQFSALVGEELTVTSEDRHEPGSYHDVSSQTAVDFDASEATLAKFAYFIGENFKSATNELIYQGPDFDERFNIGDKGFTTGAPGEARPGYYSPGTLAQHGGANSHVHWAADPNALLQMASQGDLPFSLDSLTRPGGADPSTGPLGSQTNPMSVTNPNFPALGQIPEGLSQFSDLLGNQPKSAQEAEGWLQSIDGHISDLGRQPESPLRDAQLDSLGQQRSSVMSRFGMKEGPSALDQAEGIVSGVAGLASGFMETFDAGIKYIGAWKEVSETLVRGISNTDDVMNLIDQWQIGLDFWNKVVQNASDVASFAGQFTGGADFGATSAVGGILGMVSQVMTAINTGIDLAQEGYRIATKYIGRFLTSWFGFPGASDIKFLLDEMSGQLQIYTSENPQMKTTFNTLGRSLGKEYPGRPAPQNSFTIYQGPGQDPRDTMDDAMYTVRASGVGAFGYAD